MAIGVIGRKTGMTRIFLEDGASLPVTVIEVDPNRISQIKTDEIDGYNAIQITAGEISANKVNKPLTGHFRKGAVAGRSISEFTLTESQAASKGTDELLKVGGELTVTQFEAGQKVDVTSCSKGKGFSGVVKRWNFATQDMSHGNSLSHRAPGSIGQCQTPGRVWKGKKMAGQYGNKQVTVQSLEVVKIDSENNLLLVKGAVPGAKGANVVVKPAVKVN